MRWLQKEHGRMVAGQLHVSSVVGRVTSVLRMGKQGEARVILSFSVAPL